MKASIASKNIYLTVLTTLFVVSAGINIFQISKKDNLRKDSEVARLKADSILSVRLLIEKEYNKAIIDLEEYRGKYIEVDELLNNSRQEIAMFKGRIDELQKENRNIKSLKNQLAQLKQLKESFEMQISALLKTKEDLENELNRSNSQNLSMKQELSELNKKIELARNLNASNIHVKWMKVKKGISKETNKPRKANHLEVTFDINSNPFAAAGERNILISLYDPKGQLVKNNNSGRNYSFAKQFNYVQKSEQVVMYVDFQQKPLRGKYKMEINIEGNQSNRYEFTLLDNLDIMQVSEI